MTVVPIRDGLRVPRRNRKEDQRTITASKLLRTVDPKGVEVLEATAHIVEGYLPRNQLRCVHGLLDAHQRFDVALAEAEEFEHRCKAEHARITRIRIIHGSEAASDLWDGYHRLFDDYRRATIELATTPAPTKRDIDYKRRAIGRVWLKAEGEWYDRLRAGVAADELRLTAKAGGAP